MSPVHRDGTGAARSSDYDFAALFAGRAQTLGRRYLGVYGDFEITPLVKATLDLIVNLDDHSRLVSPSTTWSVQPNLDVALGVQSFAGRAGSEYGTFNDRAFVQLQWYF